MPETMMENRNTCVEERLDRGRCQHRKGYMDTRHCGERASTKPIPRPPISPETSPIRGNHAAADSN
ncbi:hypothetical protein GLAREA_01434 [Glarea lozoyensis ATCC 20868]|uniref:Uncharacterized protein n=1 Tax=Glarea lozoyensis (strain ATCC 20868 / MF5171) TaxID=1116229 RepID=S3CG69_GLAL2|nr:uncharacterized protein GLAREA_01434 [Glarea lozoyensis ATCC 20868]EPE25522.1 hypothetical protein GLAREA_01434 [Glarea lozoyensis ATCC 20868]